jgi:hypothetical protein
LKNEGLIIREKKGRPVFFSTANFFLFLFFNERLGDVAWSLFNKNKKSAGLFT